MPNLLLYWEWVLKWISLYFTTITLKESNLCKQALLNYWWIQRIFSYRNQIIFKDIQSPASTNFNADQFIPFVLETEISNFVN